MIRLKNLAWLVTAGFFIQVAWGCPNCPASPDDNGPLGLFAILAVFIALTYIPLFMIYRKAFLKRKKFQ